MVYKPNIYSSATGIDALARAGSHINILHDNQKYIQSRDEFKET